jgi:hypothetical protein
MISLPPLKRGDTFYIGCVSKDSTSELNDLTNIQVRSQVRSAATKKLIADLPIVKLDQTEYPGQFSITSPTDTWPIGTCLLDFELKRESTVISSDTVELPIIKDITI